MTLLLLLCVGFSGGCGTTVPKLQVTVLDATHFVRLTEAEAPEAYALPDVKDVWRITDVGLEDLHQVQMRMKK